jgi:hypothetical protein
MCRKMLVTHYEKCINSETMPDRVEIRIWNRVEQLAFSNGRLPRAPWGMTSSQQRQQRNPTPNKTSISRGSSLVRMCGSTTKPSNQT